ncbi:WD40 repeat-like protein [Coemansia javaensis]|uniref:WD40 repeat-like protein n=1 Tax=Coemansia javaensis TaxID=2761396 RepID=A0A9W8HFJ2_9FUNG|nr:WD40 repeat-like protein [Coemansia javaensis]
MSFVQKEYFAPAPATTRGQPVRLSADAKGEHFVYANGRAVVVRSLASPDKAWEYRGHTAATTVARMSPSGYYIASGDVSGKVRVWDVVGEEHLAKGEHQPLGARINDIAWDADSQRILAVGDGKEQFGHVFMYDSGNSVGTVMGHSKAANACAMRQRRPLRAVTCSDDGTCVFYHGAPYKFAAALREHTGFVHDVRYAPDDEHFVTVGADRRIFLYDGKTGALVRQVAAGCSDPHRGSIFAVAWSPDGKYLVTSSGDRTCKFWDVAGDALVATVVVGGGGAEPEHQQVGNLWAGDYIVSLSLSGAVNYLRMDSAAPVRVVVGHQKPITAAALAAGPPRTLYTASYDGRVCAWALGGGSSSGAALVAGPTGDTRVEDAAAAAGGGDVVALGSLDDALRFVRGGAVDGGATVGLAAAPRSVALTADGATAVAVLQDDSVVVVRGGRAAAAAAGLGGAPRAVAVAADGAVALGFQDCTVQMFTLAADGATLAPAGPARAPEGHSREITTLAFSPDGALLASGDVGGKIVVTRAASGEVVTTRWGSHTARIFTIGWSPDGAHAASGSLDGSVIVWSVATPQRKIVIRGAHPDGVAHVCYIDAETVASAGADGAVKMWTIRHHV